MFLKIFRQQGIKTQKTTTWIYTMMKTANLLPHCLHFSPYIVRGVQLRNMRTGYIVYDWIKYIHNDVLKCHRKRTLKDLDTDEWKNLTLILKKCHNDVKLMGLALRIGSNGVIL